MNQNPEQLRFTDYLDNYTANTEAQTASAGQGAVNAANAQAVKTKTDRFGAQKMGSTGKANIDKAQKKRVKNQSLKKRTQAQA